MLRHIILQGGNSDMQTKNISQQYKREKLDQPYPGAKELYHQSTHHNIITILESISDAFFAFDNQWRFSYLNKEAERLFSVDGSELMGKKLWDVFPNNPVFYEKYQQAMAQQQTQHFEAFSLVAKAWLEVHAYPSKEGLAVYFRDISERKRMEATIRENEERFRHSFEYTNIGMALTSPAGHWLQVNPALCEILGYSQQEMQTMNFQDLTHPHDLAVGPSYKDKLLAGEIDHCQFEKRYIHKQGHTLWAEVSVSLVRDVEGRPLYFITHIQDVTHRKQMEKEMARLDRLNLVGEMAAGISHEVRNPMTTVRGFLQMLREKKDCAGFRDYFELMIEELDRANSIISEFLSIGRNKTPTLKQKNINHIVTTLLPLLQADAARYDKNVKVVLSEVPELLVCEEEIRQVILNLARNGLEAMPRGGYLTIKTFNEGNEAVLAVQDQGMGIEQHLLEKLGTPFLTTKEQGTGLGLAVCYGIAARHNASIDVQTGSTGTTFFVRFNLK